MAEPGDPPHERDHDDDMIGFASPASLQGRARETVQPTPDAGPTGAVGDSPSAPVEAGSIFQSKQEFSTGRRRRGSGTALPAGGMGLLTVYVMILFAVPTAGVSAAIGLAAVLGRAEPEDALSRSHFVYQKRTLVAAAIAAVAGVILLAAPFALGVPLLFLLALWLVLRGASGVWTLKAGRPIAHPRGWWI